MPPDDPVWGYILFCECGIELKSDAKRVNPWGVDDWIVTWDFPELSRLDDNEFNEVEVLPDVADADLPICLRMSFCSALFAHKTIEIIFRKPTKT